jgi:DNA-binding NtrC family response regulator
MSKNVLIMEDDAALRKFFQQVLSHSNCAVATSSSRMDALHHIHNHQFDYLLFDIEVEDGNAMDLIAQCCNEGYNVIVITANDQYLAECKKIGVLAFIRKPIAASDLIKLVNNIDDLDLPHIYIRQ